MVVASRIVGILNGRLAPGLRVNSRRDLIDAFLASIVLNVTRPEWSSTRHADHRPRRTIGSDQYTKAYYFRSSYPFRQPSFNIINISREVERPTNRIVSPHVRFSSHRRYVAGRDKARVLASRFVRQPRHNLSIGTGAVARCVQRRVLTNVRYVQAACDNRRAPTGVSRASLPEGKGFPARACESPRFSSRRIHTPGFTHDHPVP